MKKLTIAASLLIALIAAKSNAASIYFDIPGITGESSIPGSPNVILADKGKVSVGDFQITKTIDKSSPALYKAAANGTSFPGIRALIFNSTPTATPDAQITFPGAVDTGYTDLGNFTEVDTFSSTAPTSIYLELPGIVGASSTPGHPDIISLESFTLSGSELSVEKDTDIASPFIAGAALTHEVFPTAQVLLYDSASASDQPYDTLVFHDVTADSFLAGNVSSPTENDSFSFGTITSPVPEPGSLALMFVGMSAIGCRARRR